MRISNLPDFAVAVAFIAAGAGVSMIASGYAPLPGSIVGAGLFPLITGGAMILFGGVLALQAWHSLPEVEAVCAEPEDEAVVAANPPLLNGFALGTVAIIAVAAGLMPVFGFIVTGTAMSICAILLSGGRWPSALIFSPVATLTLFYLFVYVFGVPLPRGIIG